MSKIEKGREYEIYINDYLKTLPETENSYLWDEVPEKILYEAGLINLYNIKKLGKKQSKTNPLKDVGIDIIMVNKTGEIEFVQCKYYDGSSLTLDKLSGFWFMMAKHKTTKGSIYHTSSKVSHWLKQIPDRITLKYKQIENKTPSDASSPNDNTPPHTGKGPQNESLTEKSNDHPNAPSPLLAVRISSHCLAFFFMCVFVCMYFPSMQQKNANFVNCPIVKKE